MTLCCPCPLPQRLVMSEAAKLVPWACLALGLRPEEPLIFLAYPCPRLKRVYPSCIAGSSPLGPRHWSQRDMLCLSNEMASMSNGYRGNIAAKPVLS